MSVDIYNMDCMDYMRDLPDNAFDLAIVDPPYGLRRHQRNDNNNLNNRFHTCTWDLKPKKLYFDELFRISKNQIIFGANNFSIPPSEYFFIWDKQQTVENFSSAEFAWVSEGLGKPAKIYRYGINRHNAEERGYKIHPTQKPIALYSWALRTYARQNQSIIDTHLGSGSSAIAAHYFGCDFVGLEIDEGYYLSALNRFENETRQLAMF